MKIIVNGKENAVEAGTTIRTLLEQLAVPTAGTAVAVENAIVPRDEHATHTLEEGDVVDILRPIGGG